jgi:P27 family predicted phage terminase small subunit
LEGVHPYRLNRDEPVPADLPVMPPVPLPADAQAVWNRLAPDMVKKRVLTSWDVDLFAVFCRSTALFNRAAAAVEKSGLTVQGSAGNRVVNPQLRVMTLMAEQMRSIGQRFGLTPGDRATLRIEPNIGPKTGAERFLT